MLKIIDDSITSAKNEIKEYFEQGYGDAVDEIGDVLDAVNNNLQSQLSDIAIALDNIDIPETDLSPVTEAIGIAKSDILDAIDDIVIPETSLDPVLNSITSSKSDIITALDGVSIDPTEINTHTTAEADRIINGITTVVYDGGNQLNQHMSSVESAITDKLDAEFNYPDPDDNPDEDDSTLLSRIRLLFNAQNNAMDSVNNILFNGLHEIAEELLELKNRPQNFCLNFVNPSEYIVQWGIEGYKIINVVYMTSDKYVPFREALINCNIGNLNILVDEGLRSISSGIYNPIVGAYNFNADGNLTPLADRSIVPSDVIETSTAMFLENPLSGILMNFDQSLNGKNTYFLVDEGEL